MYCLSSLARICKTCGRMYQRELLPTTKNSKMNCGHQYIAKKLNANAGVCAGTQH